MLSAFCISNKEYRTDVKQRPKGSNLFTEATQLSLLWQRWRSKMADILDLKPYNSKTISVTPKFYLIKWFLLVYITSLTNLRKFCKPKIFQITWTWLLYYKSSFKGHLWHVVLLFGINSLHFFVGAFFCLAPNTKLKSSKSDKVLFRFGTNHVPKVCYMASIESLVLHYHIFNVSWQTIIRGSGDIRSTRHFENNCTGCYWVFATISISSRTYFALLRTS